MLEVQLIITLMALFYAYLWANQRVQTAAPSHRPTRPSRTRQMKRESFKRLPQTTQEPRVILVGRKW